jgi:5-formyltetrahydrofolate cyclo-ligase
MINCSNKSEQKQYIRKLLLERRKQISDQRRSEAKNALLKTIYPLLSTYTSILSFCNFSFEIDTYALNSLLALEGRLLLPKIDGEHLQIYRVWQLEKQLGISSVNLLEPIADSCTPCSIDAIDCVLVPGVGFDRNKHRIGYGKGYYDRFIAQAKRISSKKTPHFMGIGFEEQLFSEGIPCQSHDQSVDEIFLF